MDFLSGLKKDDKILPVITLVVHFGQEPWDGPMGVHDMFAVQKPEILKFVPDYRINLISPISMERSEIEKFTTDFRELAKFIHCGRDKAALLDLIENDEHYKHMDPLTANIANNLTNSKLKLKANRKGEIDMCVAMAGIIEDSRKEGISIGEKRGISIGRNEGIQSAMDALIREGYITPEIARSITINEG